MAAYIPGMQPTNKYGQLYFSSYRPEELNIVGIKSYQGQSLYFYEKMPFARAIIDTVVTQAINQGIRLSVAKEYKSIANEFRLFCKEIDFMGRHSFAALQAYAFRTMLVSGDAFLLLIQNKNNLKIRVINGSSVNSYGIISNYNDGVLLDGNGRHKAYSIYDLKKKKQVDIPVYDALKRKQIFQIAELNTANQVRGMPFLAPIFNSLLLYSKYEEIDFAAFEKLRYFMLALKEMGGEIDRNTKTDDTKTIKAIEENKEKKSIIKMKPGVDIVAIESKTQPINPEPAIERLMRNSTASVGVPLDVVIKKYDKSYSASKMTSNQFMEKIKMQQGNFCDNFQDPIFSRFLEIHHPKVKNNIRYKWICNEVRAIDPVKEAAAAEKKIKIGISSSEEQKEILEADEIKE